MVFFDNFVTTALRQKKIKRRKLDDINKKEGEEENHNVVAAYMKEVKGNSGNMS